MTSTDPSSKMLTFANTIELLSDGLNATCEELAAWVFMGPKHGGLAAYLNANELKSPPRFLYDPGNGKDFDYLSPLMACWFLKEDIAEFLPTERFITGKTLIDRWSIRPHIQPEAFIRAMIAQSRLIDIHPLSGGTQESLPADQDLPPLETGLFAMSDIEAIESEEFGNKTKDGRARIAQEKVAPEIGSEEWRRENARNAAKARHNQPGGYRDKKRQALDEWRTGKYETHTECANQIHKKLGLAIKTVQNYLRNEPKAGP